ncbi:MAG: hypothetical protein V1834_04775 [Candidatus Micrarchaeota archaeon]
MGIVESVREFLLEDDGGQTAIEYILIIGLGLFVLIIGFALAFYVNDFSKATTQGVEAARKDTLNMLVK